MSTELDQQYRIRLDHNRVALKWALRAIIAWIFQSIVVGFLGRGIFGLVATILSIGLSFVALWYVRRADRV